MVTNNHKLAVLLASAILMMSIVGPATAQNNSSSPDSIILDSTPEEISTIGIDNNTYTVYSVNNALPYASGYEVYSNGQEVTDPDKIQSVLSILAAKRTFDDVNTTVSPSSVTSQEAARNQFEVVAWEVSANELSKSDMQRLQSISDAASRIDRIVSPVLRAVNIQLEVFDTMKNTGLFGVTVWDTATDAYPTLAQYEQSLQTIQDELSGLNEAAEGISQNIDPAIASLGEAQQAKKVDYQRLSQQLEQAASSLEELQSKVDQVESSISTAQEGANEAEEGLRSSSVPSEFVQPLGDLSNSLEQASSDLEAFSSDLQTSRQQLSSVRQTSADTRQSLTDEWRAERSSAKSQYQNRQSAQTRVYGTFGGIGITGVGLLLLTRRLI